MQPANNNTAPSAMRPRRLTLAFSRAADTRRVQALFAPAVKQQFDPHNYVAQRVKPAFDKALRDGSAAMLSDPYGHIATLTIAYRMNHPAHGPALPHANDNGHEITELGTSLARLPGYNSAQLVVAALTLREWWLAPPGRAMIAEIKRDNIPSRKTYEDALGWRPQHDAAESEYLYEAADQTVADAAHKGAGSNIHPAQAPSCWYQAGDETIRRSAGILLGFMAQGGLHNKHTGHTIPVDFSALAQTGLTPARLQALAAGQLDRTALRRIANPPPPAP